ncbi:hypothetical protein D9758_008962 [Tetrapyrgos nigripes]|uniref:Uncharacterized protein n=1 Tax=Tetrapyrgos nigripes TaxID=182062 RepID=A0A8H5GKS8_9AGAR|nr:hypothetical protein D9758_008962 [Tetrapyrgos nigripes]
MSTSSEMETYLKALRRDGITQNWDVVVTYDEASINDLLLQRYNEPNTGLSTKVEPSFVTTDRDDIEYTQYYSLDLGPPLIQFQDTPNEPTCDLTMPILSGRIWRVDTADGKVHPTTELKGGIYSIIIAKISLGTISGETEAGDIKHGNDIVEFPLDKISDEQIVINFPASGTLDYRITYPSDMPGNDIPWAMHENNLLVALCTYFPATVKAIHYALAGINNQPPASGVVDLIPHTFRIVTYKDNDTNPAKSYLSVLIQTRGSTVRGNTKQLQSSWNAQWVAANVNPVPVGKSASIIINNAFFVTSFITPTLKGSNQITDVVPEALKPDESGLQVKCTWNKSVKTDSKHFKDKINDPYDEPKLTKVDVPALDYNPNDPRGLPLRITFGQAQGLDKPATILLEWKYSFHQTWTGVMSCHVVLNADDWRGDERVMPKNTPVKGGFTATFTLNKVFDIKPLTQEDLNVSIDFNKDDWKVEVKPDEAGNLRQRLGATFGGTEQVGYLPNFIKDSAIEGIGFNFNFGTLRFFSITNVFLPGRKVIDVDHKTGLRIPRDLIIVGNVVPSTSPSA